MLIIRGGNNAASKVILMIQWSLVDINVSIYLYMLIAYILHNVVCYCAQLSIAACNDEIGRSATEAEQRLA